MYYIQFYFFAIISLFQRSNFYCIPFLLACHWLLYCNDRDPLLIIILEAFVLVVSIATSFLSCKHTLKKSGRAWRNIGKYTIVNPNRTVSLSKFSFFKLLQLLIRSYQVPVFWFVRWPFLPFLSLKCLRSLLPDIYHRQCIPLRWNQKTRHTQVSTCVSSLLWIKCFWFV